MRAKPILALCLLAALVAMPMAMPAHTAEPAEADKAIAVLRQEVAALRQAASASQARLAALEATVTSLAEAARSTREALAREMAQPMLLLVGEGACPAGFERIPLDAMLLTGPRTLQTQEIIERAGLANEHQPGVGPRVYRHLDFCFREAHSVRLP